MILSGMRTIKGTMTNHDHMSLLLFCRGAPLDGAAFMSHSNTWQQYKYLLLTITTVEYGYACKTFVHNHRVQFARRYFSSRSYRRLFSAESVQDDGVPLSRMVNGI